MIERRGAIVLDQEMREPRQGVGNNQSGRYPPPPVHSNRGAQQHPTHDRPNAVNHSRGRLCCARARTPARIRQTSRKTSRLKPLRRSLPQDVFRRSKETLRKRKRASPNYLGSRCLDLGRGFRFSSERRTGAIPAAHHCNALAPEVAASVLVSLFADVRRPTEEIPSRPSKPTCRIQRSYASSFCNFLPVRSRTKRTAPSCSMYQRVST